jgi:hypothetical protein
MTSAVEGGPGFPHVLPHGNGVQRAATSSRLIRAKRLTSRDFDTRRATRCNAVVALRI